MHLIQIGNRAFIDAEKIEFIFIQPITERLEITTRRGIVYYADDKYKERAIKDILTNCTPTSGRDALQGMVSG